MTESEITDVLFKKYGEIKEGYQNALYAAFSQFRTKTGFADKKDNISIIDFYAVSFYKKVQSIACEVKISRSDFLSDIKRFHEKHADALKYSTQFYYVTPFNLISPDEIPVDTGLMYVNAGFKLEIKKIAPIRNMVVDEQLLQSFLFNQQKIIPRPVSYCKFLGEELTEEQIQNIVNERVKQNIKRREENLEFDKKRLEDRIVQVNTESDLIRKLIGDSYGKGYSHIVGYLERRIRDFTELKERAEELVELINKYNGSCGE